jgi:hypothetical protein
MSLPTRDEIASCLEATLVPMVEEGPPPSAEPAPEVKGHLDDLVSKGHKTVRDGILTLLAMEVAYGSVIDWRSQPLHNPARGASRFLGSILYPKLHIAGSPEALQTGVKGTGTYMDRSNETWQAVLRWASEQTDVEEIEAAYLYLATRVADTAKAVPELPPLDTPRLTFARIFVVVDGMLLKPSGGAHEQLIFASLLDAWREQLGLPGVVETKHVNAADSAAGTAADVQARQGGQVTDAYEVTAEPFTSKVAQAARTLLQHDLKRVQILAKGAAKATAEEIQAAVPEDADLTVLDVREEIRSLLARLDKPHRRVALESLYRFLVDKQPNDSLVKAYVDALVSEGLSQPE